MARSPRRPGDWNSLLVLVVLAAIVWGQRERLLTMLHGGPMNDDGKQVEAFPDRAGDSIVEHAAAVPEPAGDGLDTESTAVPLGAAPDMSRPASSTEAAHELAAVDVELAGSTKTGAPLVSGDAPLDGPSAADDEAVAAAIDPAAGDASASATSRNDIPLSELAPGSAGLADGISVEQTRTGLKRYIAPIPTHRNARRLVDDPIEDALLAAVEAAPEDDAAVALLVEHLTTAEREDEALEQLVRAAEAGADVSSRRPALDPYAARKGTLLLEAGRRLASLSAEAEGRGFWLCATAWLDGAEALLEGAALEGDVSDPQLASRLAERRALMLRRGPAVDALDRAGAPMPDDVVFGSRLRASADTRRDESAARANDELAISSKHAVVSTLLSTSVARQAAEVVDAVHAAVADRHGVAPSGDGRLAVELVGDEAVFASRRHAITPEPPPFAGAWLADDDTRLVALDPRQSGGDLDRLWSLVARETARRIIRRVPGKGRPLPPWLEWGLAVRAEGVVVRGGDVTTHGPPTARRRQLLASHAGRGVSPLEISELLSDDGSDPAIAAWSWGLVTWLDAGAPGLMDAPRFQRPLDALLSMHRDGSSGIPTEAFRAVVLTRVDGTRVSIREAQLAFSRWLDAMVDVARGDELALDRVVTSGRDALAHRHPDVAEDLARQALTSRPEHIGARKLIFDIARRGHRDDEALLAALALGTARARRTGSDPASERYVEAMAIIPALAERIVQHDEQLRADAGALIDELLSDDRPLAATRLLDRLLAAAPLDGGWRAARERITKVMLGVDDVEIVRRIPVVPEAGELHGDVSLWRSRGAAVGASSADRAAPTTLRGLGRLGSRWTVSATVRFDPSEKGGRHPDDGYVFAGLLFGAASPIEQGNWGVFVSPAGQVELARRGRLEWPSFGVGRGSRGETRIEVAVDGDRLQITAAKRALGELDLGSRPADGWLALFARRASVVIDDIRVVRSRRIDPRRVWFTRGDG